eukprot:8742073-Pyramimonas_sp.AAC.1
MARWINTRARRDARRLGVPIFSLRTVGECSAIRRGLAPRRRPGQAQYGCHPWRLTGPRRHG